MLAALLAGSAVQAADLRAPVRAYRQAHERQILEEFTALLALPNVATNLADPEANAALIARELQQRGGCRICARASRSTPRC